ncbi:hypothetical protein HaLaN_04324, partial [Haematococcus lacustris]
MSGTGCSTRSASSRASCHRCCGCLLQSRVRQRLQHEMAARAASLAGPFVPSGRADPLAMMR